MERANFEKSLKTFVRRQPFVPFTVELMSGARFTVEHPEALAFYGGVAVYLATGADEFALFDHQSVARLVRNGKSSHAAKKGH